MVLSIRGLKDVAGTVRYFYYTEKGLETQSGMHRKNGELGLINKQLFEEGLRGIVRLGKNNVIQLGKKTKDGIDHNPGHDLTFSAPKSASIMALVMKDKRVLKAHEKAVTQALNFCQSKLLYTRVQEAGVSRHIKINTSAIARFTHTTSRPTKNNIPKVFQETNFILRSERRVSRPACAETHRGRRVSDKMKDGFLKDEGYPDPQLHTHAIMMNVGVYGARNTAL